MHSATISLATSHESRFTSAAAAATAPRSHPTTAGVDRRRSSATMAAPTLSGCMPPARMPRLHIEPRSMSTGNGRHQHCRRRQGEG